jgi:aspartate carbamoyltransferase catalytic subunit
MTASTPVSSPLGGTLLDVEGLSGAELERVCDLAVEMREARAERRHRRLLEDETVALAFFEPSTRTRVSFELAARALGATTVDFAAEASSVRKGESLVDTVRTLERTGVTILIIRHPAAGAAHLAARETGMRIVNAGDGAHAHPTQALLDLLTLREALGPLAGRTVAIVGDVVHSRVARSDIHALTAVGARVRVGGPAPWVAGFEDWPGVEVATSVDAALRDAAAVVSLRVQLERDAGADGISLAHYVRDWRLDSDRLGLARPGAPVLHPGPTNEGCEITAELANGPRSLIGRQVENGVPVRMAVLALLAGAA